MNERKIAVLITVFFLVVLSRLVQLQIFEGEELRRLSEENRLRIIKLPSPRGIIYDRNGNPLVENAPYYAVAILPEMMESIDPYAVAQLLGLDPEEVIRKIKSKRPFESVRLKEGLSFEDVAFIEARLSDFPGLGIDVDLTRNYIYGDMAAHVIGYLGRLTPDQAKRPNLKDVPAHSFIGQWGVEQLYDETLRGTAGERIIEVDALGRQLRLIKENPAVKGKDLYLSLDLDMQREAEDAMGNRVGAITAINPNTGEVLALVSKPSFDPNLFAKGIKYDDWVSLMEDETHPMLNRALQSHYPPGSVFKIITATAALESKTTDPKAKVTCTGELNAGSWTFRCWKKGGHGSVALYEAIIGSCDVYFYTAGRRAGIDNIAKYAREYGIGTETGLNIVREKPGFMPDEAWKMKTKQLPWYLGETYNCAIGQGYVLMTPAQVARLMGTVANGGHLYNLTLERTNGEVRPIKDIDVSKETLDLVRKGLKGVVNDPAGTGHNARSQYFEVAGKTGTSQVRSSKVRGAQTLEKFKDHAWFGAYAPADKPEVAIAVFVEHGGGGGAVAAPIAKRAIEAYLVKKKEPKDDD